MPSHALAQIPISSIDFFWFPPYHPMNIYEPLIETKGLGFQISYWNLLYYLLFLFRTPKLFSTTILIDYYYINTFLFTSDPCKNLPVFVLFHITLASDPNNA